MDPKILERLEINELLVMSCGWTWWHQNVLAISDRPKSIYQDDLGRLHHPAKKAIEYRDGWGFYAWHGVRIPAEWIESPASLTAEIAITWKNIEQRRAACEILGWTNILEKLNTRVVDKDDDPQVGILLECEIPGSGKERFLQVKCGTGRNFCIPVPREMMSALHANMWTYGLDADRSFIPEVRT